MKNKEFDSEFSIQSDEEIKQIIPQYLNTKQPFFHNCFIQNLEFEERSTSETKSVQLINSLFLSPEFKFKGNMYINEIDDINFVTSDHYSSKKITDMTDFSCELKSLNDKKRKIDKKNTQKSQSKEKVNQKKNTSLDKKQLKPKTAIILKQQHNTILQIICPTSNRSIAMSSRSANYSKKQRVNSNSQIKGILKSTDSFDPLLPEKSNQRNLSQQIIRMPEKKVSFILSKEQAKKYRNRSKKKTELYLHQKTRFQVNN